MWLVLQQDEPDDYVIATGEQHTVRGFAERAFAYAGIELEMESATGLQEQGVDKKNGNVVVAVNPAFYRRRCSEFMR